MARKVVVETDRELLIRIDARTEHLPALSKKVARHDSMILILSLTVGFVIWQKYPFIIEALAKAFN